MRGMWWCLDEFSSVQEFPKCVLEKLFFPADPSGAAHHAAGFGTCMIAILEDLLAVHKHVNHAGGVLMWLLIRRMIPDAVRVKNDNVRIVFTLQATALPKLQCICGKRRQPSDRFFKRYYFFVAHIAA